MTRPIKNKSELAKIERAHKAKLLRSGTEDRQRIPDRGKNTKLSTYGIKHPIPILARKKIRDAETMTKLNKGL